ncbi:MAG TPA: IS481 family transposase [Candidatus Acidoferrales bacterium]|nr:IS481 family transposase [Candidatus Acidoferrales bacterium]
MPWARTDVGSERIKFVVRAVARKERMTALCRAFGISRTTGYRWRRRYLEAGNFQAVVERSRRPQRSPGQTTPALEARVVEWRQQSGWGAKKIAVLLREEGLELTVTTINRILKRRGLVDPRDGTSPALQRFARSTPNELWQMDGKGDYGARDGRCYPLSILDDHSRYAVGLYALPAFTAELIYPCLVHTFESYGVPQAMLMDRGSVWWATTNGYGLTWLSVRLIEQGIQLCYGRPYHPQTQGKIERFHRTLDEAVRHRGKPQTLGEWPGALEEFRRVYNERRPHEALEMQRPAQRYRPSARAYQPAPREWEYPSGSVMQQLDTGGSLSWEGRRWFVCEALAGRWVRVEEVPSQSLLVSYRHMYVREIDRGRGRTRPLVMPRDRDGALRSPSGLPPSPVPIATPGGEV